MTDMRATERLLEVIESQQSDMLALMLGFPEDSLAGELRKKINASRDAVIELRRRGDTLVRREDLMHLYGGFGDELPDSDPEAMRRIEIALGRA